MLELRAQDFLCCMPCDVTAEQVEPIILAVIQLAVEFALCYLEKSIRYNDDIMLQVCTYWCSHWFYLSKLILFMMLHSEASFPLLLE